MALAAAAIAAPRARAKRVRTQAHTLEPFTVPHFRQWASQLVLEDEVTHLAIEPFQDAFLADLFAGFIEAWLVLAEGNGKTSLVAAITLYYCKFRRNQYVPVAASSREQAETLYKQAEGFVERSGLEGDFKCLPGYRRINCRATGSRMQIYAADDATGDGVIPTLAIVEELHRHRDMKLYRTWRGKVSKRKGQIIAISTAGEPGTEFETARSAIIAHALGGARRVERFMRVVAGKLVLHDWSISDDDDPEDLEAVKGANPFSAITVETLHEKRHSLTMTLAHWLRFVCNRATRGERSAITEAEWKGALTAERIPAGESVDVGIDVARKWDTTAIVPLWMRSREVRILGPATILTPPRDGTSLKNDPIKAAIESIHHRNPIRRAVIDPHDASEIAEWMRSELGIEVVERGQSNSFAVMDYDRFMEGLRTGWLKHTGDAGLTKHVMNSVARLLPGGETRFDRPSSARQGGDQERRVIDALVAAGMVHSVAVAPIEVKAKPRLRAW